MKTKKPLQISYIKQWKFGILDMTIVETQMVVRG